MPLSALVPSDVITNFPDRYGPITTRVISNNLKIDVTGKGVTSIYDCITAIDNDVLSSNEKDGRKQLGSACDLEFKANTSDEIVALIKKQGIDMFQKNHEAILAVMQKMQSLMQKTNVMKEWLESKKTEFEESPSL